MFVAIKGTQVDGHNYIDQAITQGATSIVCEVLPENLEKEITYVQVDSGLKALGQIAANFYQHPSKRLQLVAITGTNGKTTTATLLFQLFRDLGYNVGLISTVHNRINDQVIAATHTTPDAITLNTLLNRMVEAGCTHCFMEASSHAIEQERIAGDPA